MNDKLGAVNRVIVGDNVGDSDQTSELLCDNTNGARCGGAADIHLQQGTPRALLQYRIGKHKSVYTTRCMTVRNLIFAFESLI